MPVPIVSLHLDNVEYALENFAETPGFDRMLSDIKNSSPNSQEGIRFELEQMAELDNPSAVTSVDQAFPNGCGTECRFDLRIGDKYIEYKSVSGALTTANRQQFNTYLGNVGSINNLEYVFDESKKTIEQAKATMQTMINTDPAAVFASMSPAFRQSINIRANLTPRQQRDAFDNLVRDTNSILYRFVTVQ